MFGDRKNPLGFGIKESWAWWHLSGWVEDSRNMGLALKQKKMEEIFELADLIGQVGIRALDD